MNWDNIEGNWEQMKGKVREAWGKLTDDDMDVIQGKREQLLGKLQDRYGYAREKASAEINNFIKTCEKKFSKDSKKSGVVEGSCCN